MTHVFNIEEGTPEEVVKLLHDWLVDHSGIFVQDIIIHPTFAIDLQTDNNDMWSARVYYDE